MKLDLDSYQEMKPNRWRRIAWYLVNHSLYRIGTWTWRAKLLRRFGANIGGHYAIYRSIEVYDPANLETGCRVLIGPRVDIYNKAQITLGNNVIVSQDAYLCTASHDISSPTMELVLKPIVICDNVWIGSRATILPGVTIGEGAVVGACAVVAKDVPPWSVVVGNPARVVGRRELKGV